LPESPRFLVQNKKHYKAFQIIKKIWLVNNKKEKRLKSNEEGTIQNLLKRNEAEFFNLNTSIIQKFDVITNQNSKQLNSSLDETTQNNAEDSNALRYLFKSTRNFCKTFILSFISFSTSLCYYGRYFLNCDFLKFLEENEKVHDLRKNFIVKEFFFSSLGLYYFVDSFYFWIYFKVSA
jgi:hypothetical protein